MAGGPLGLGVLPKLKRIVQGKKKRRHKAKKRHARRRR